jgi:transcription-repair coupling factor (superfamily II helicase)
MQNLLDMHQIHALRVENFQEAQKVKGKSVGLTVHAIERGFVAGNIAFISEQDLLGERAQIKLNKKKRLENFLQEASSLNIGELVVHNEHGIGRFSGLETISVLGIKRDCILITYAQGDKLYIPVENIDVITRYGSEVAALDKLGSLNWQTRKAKLKNRIKLAAIELIKVAAARELKAAPVIIAQENLYQEFCARFAYPETPDQMQAIEEVKQDLAQGKPMDRLICGDVGFGKTEVAMRAAFMCVFNDAMIRNQVAIVVPTTILAKQHYYTLQKRFAGFNVRIKLTSRMVSAKENKLIKQGLANGEVDIVVGTHALLAKDVIFKNLSMLIIDEEQHFGVAQKEKLKSLKANIHVLTLSATPIPRTLQMSLAGIKELSLIATPPLDRLAVRTSVLEFDDIIVREAILREYMRSGKCFYVCPHIADLANVAAMLKNLVPEIKFLTAHGQMPANELDDIMNNFYEGKFDLLLSTTIVESGLDIPGANTIFIHHAQKLGLSQLYQLRGRVGRGKVRAYAYLLSSSNAALSKDAVKRLEVMEKLNTLGAGFSIASHDMDIRGFGNLVGDEQSGHIKEVGIELYQKMLADEVAALQHDQAEKPSQDDYSISINLGLSVLIPQEYISDLALRLSLYQKIAALKDAVEIEQMAIEMVDRFGVLPIETKQLLAVVALKQLCRKLNINKIDVKAKGLLVSFYQDEPAFKEQFLKYILLHPKMFALRADHKLLINIALNPLNTDEIRNVLAEIIKNLPTFK